MKNWARRLWNSSVEVCTGFVCIPPVISGQYLAGYKASQLQESLQDLAPSTEFMMNPGLLLYAKLLVDGGQLVLWKGAVFDHRFVKGRCSKSSSQMLLLLEESWSSYTCNEPHIADITISKNFSTLVTSMDIFLKQLHVEDMSALKWLKNHIDSPELWRWISPVL